MTNDCVILASFGLALWSAVIGGVFSAFSEFIMSGLKRAAPASGIEAMQHINKTVLNTSFVLGLMAIAPLSIAMAYHGWMTQQGPVRTGLVTAAAVYVPAVFLMTLFGNVPMNNRLASLDHSSEEAAAYWKFYGRRWTRLNHVRTIGCVLISVSYLVSGSILIATVSEARG